MDKPHRCNWFVEKDLFRLGYTVTHGDGEAQRFFPLHEIVNRDGLHNAVKQWFNEVHAYERGDLRPWERDDDEA